MKTFAILILVNLAALATAGAIFKFDDVVQKAPECDPTTGVVLPHETDCEKYYVCAGGEATLYTCEDEMLFDLTYDGCNFAELTYCGDRERPPGYASTIKPPPPSPGVTPDPEFKCPEPGGAFAHPVFCELYYVCVEDSPTLHSCIEDQLFDEKYAGCNFAEQTDCGDRIRPNGTATQRPTEPSVTGDGSFECPEPGGAFEHPEKCELFYVCIDAESTLETCPEGLLFDNVYDGCNFAEYVDCGDRERPPGSGTNKPTVPTEAPGTGPTEPPGDEFECPEPTGYFADPEDCSAFYQCDNSLAVHNLCPPPLYFNDIIGVCDHRVNVECGDRPEPTK